jgi:alkylated DNA nucleotide flippase Atl1
VDTPVASSRPSEHDNDPAVALGRSLLDLASGLESVVGRWREQLQAEFGEHVHLPAVRGERQRAIAALPELFNPNGMTASEVARRADYDEANTYTVLDSLVKSGLLEVVPNSNPRRWRMSQSQRKDRVFLASRLIDEGEWTTYGDIAVAVFGNLRMARAIGQITSNPAFANPHRVLGANGIVNPEWVDGQGNGPEYCQALLEREGVRFIAGHADKGQQVNFEELRARLAQAAS